MEDGKIPKVIFDSIKNLTSYEFQILTQLERDLEKRENSAERNQQKDNDMFSNFNNYLYVSSVNFNESRIKNFFGQVMDVVTEYEEKGNNVHKGSIYVNFAIVCLRTGDIMTALHYFYKAEYEEKLIGNHNFNILDSEFFEKNYWIIIKGVLLKQLLDTQMSRFEKLYGTKPNYEDINSLITFNVPQFNLQILGFLTRFVQVYNRELRNIDGTPISSTATSFFYLIGELGTLYESILRDKLNITSTQTFHGMLETELTHSKIGDISQEIRAIHSDSNLKITSNGGITEFNNHIVPLINEIFSETNQVRLLALCLYLLKSTRNNIIHDISVVTPYICGFRALNQMFLSRINAILD